MLANRGVVVADKDLEPDCYAVEGLEEMAKLAFSANLGFLFAEHSLPNAIRAAHNAGFAAVECHWPFDTPPEQVRTALEDTGLRMLSLNTRRGDVANGDNGLAAVPGRVDEARAAIAEAIDYAVAIDCSYVHVMAGFASGSAAHETFLSNLAYASELARENGRSILIEPLNRIDAPGYFLNTSEQASAILVELAADNTKLMFDCYHIQIQEGDLTRRLNAMRDCIGHIQFASVPDRGPPGSGEVNYPWLFKWLDENEFIMPLGAEYRPQGTTASSLGWLGS